MAKVNEVQDLAVDTLEVAPEVAEALNDADREIIEAGDLAEKVAADEGVKLKVKDNAPRERRELTPAQFMRRAQNQREVGLRMLNNRRGGLAAVTQPVRIDNYLVAATFTRFFPVIDQCLFTLRAQGEFRLGNADANRITDQILARIEEFTSMAKSELNASEELVKEVLEREYSVTPSYSDSAYTGEVQAKTPEALRLLEAFRQFDKVVLNIETLHWNGERTQSDVQDAIQMQKRAISPLFVLCTRTSIQMRNRVQARGNQSQ